MALEYQSPEFIEWCYCGGINLMRQAVSELIKLKEERARQDEQEWQEAQASEEAQAIYDASASPPRIHSMYRQIQSHRFDTTNYKNLRLLLREAEADRCYGYDENSNEELCDLPQYLNRLEEVATQLYNRTTNKMFLEKLKEIEDHETFDGNFSPDVCAAIHRLETLARESEAISQKGKHSHQ